jgi:hypothetical protein
MKFSIDAGNCRAPLVEHARQDDVTAETTAEAARGTLRKIECEDFAGVSHRIILEG